MNYYGIDLGTNSSVLARFNKDNSNSALEILKINGNENIKSIIILEDLTNVSIGDEKGSNLSKSLYRIKGKLANEKAVEINNGKVSVQFCAALLLSYLKKHIPDNEDIVITVPNFYDQSKRNATIDAGKQAGFSKIKLIEEPSAAAMYHIYKSYNKNSNEYILKTKNILIFDFGAGTLDLSLVNISFDGDNKIKPSVIKIHGLENFGGYLIDLIIAQEFVKVAIYNNDDEITRNKLKEILNILDYNLKSYRDKNNEELFRYDDEINEILYKFVTEAERVKIGLSKDRNMLINIDGYIYNVKITREEFEDIIFEENYLKDDIEKFIVEFKIDNRESIDEVILVGGTSRMPCIQDIVKQSFINSLTIIDDDYINAVAYGAAIISALWGGEDIAPFGTNLCKGVMPRDMYLKFNNAEYQIIKSGTGYPLMNSKEIKIKIPFSLVPSLNIQIIEKDNGEEKLVSRTEFFHPCFFTGDIINFVIHIDENGMIDFNVIHNETRENIEFSSYKENALSLQLIENGKKHIMNKVVFTKGEKLWEN